MRCPGWGVSLPSPRHCCIPFHRCWRRTPGYPHGDGSCSAPCDCGGVPCGECEELRQFCKSVAVLPIV